MPRGPELFDAGDDRVFCFNPSGRFHGWLLLRHGQTEFTPIRQLNSLPLVPGFNVERALLGVRERPCREVRS